MTLRLQFEIKVNLVVEVCLSIEVYGLSDWPFNCQETTEWNMRLIWNNVDEGMHEIKILQTQIANISCQI